MKKFRIKTSSFTLFFGLPFCSFGIWLSLYNLMNIGSNEESRLLLIITYYLLFSTTLIFSVLCLIGFPIMYIFTRKRPLYFEMNDEYFLCPTRSIFLILKKPVYVKIYPHQVRKIVIMNILPFVVQLSINYDQNTSESKTRGYTFSSDEVDKGNFEEIVAILNKRFSTKIVDLRHRSKKSV
ncbi:MAG: hypothetical protein HQK49_13235 [Oligoflexia bacterium]|nr:hypothetical protein [Oligoflexia bacterium]